MSISQINPASLPPPGDADSIIQIPPRRQLEGLAAMLPGDRRDRSRARRFVAYAQANAVPLDLLFGVVDRRGRITLASLAVPSSGRTAMLFHTCPRSSDEVAPIGRLINHVCHETSRRNVAIAQVLVERGAQLERSALESGGFHKLADLSYLERPCSGQPLQDIATPNWPGEHTFEPYSDAHREDWITALDASYVDTLDCSGLLGLRQTADILDGHLGTGRFDPSLWQLLRIDGRPVGVIMFNPASTGDTIELVYTGLAAEARGQGIGRLLLHMGLQLLRGRDERSITLAVDEANQPALRLYESFGFRRVLRRLAMIRPLDQRDGVERN